jgi:mRNA-degrading endonuclease RelE of RelBE toxin-antitoxin system
MLTGTLGTFWRYRIGDYRAICHIETDSATVLVLLVTGAPFTLTRKK